MGRPPGSRNGTPRRSRTTASSGSLPAAHQEQFQLAVSSKDTKYGRSKLNMSPPAKLRRHYPNEQELNYWFAYESKEIYYPIILIRPSDASAEENSALAGVTFVGHPQHHSKVIHLEKGHGVEVSMTITARGNGPDTEPAVIHAKPVKDVFWFKAIKAYIFGKIELRFDVINKSGYLNEAQLPDPLIFTIDVSVDIHGNKAPDTSMLIGLGDGSYYDYVYDESSEGEGEGDDDEYSDGHDRSYARSSRNRNPRPKSRHNIAGSASSSAGGGKGFSKYESGTFYDPDYFAKPRHSYVPSGTGGSNVAAKRPRHSAGSSSETMQGRGHSQSDRKKIPRTTSTAIYNNINRSISPSPDSGDAFGYSKSFGDIQVIEQIQRVQHQLLPHKKEIRGVDGDGDDNMNEGGGTGAEFIDGGEGERSDEEEDNPGVANRDLHEDSQQAPRFRSYSRDPGDIDSEGEDGRLRESDVDGRKALAPERQGSRQPTSPFDHTLLEQQQETELDVFESKDRPRQSSPPRMKVTSSAGIASRNASNASSSNAGNKVQLERRAREKERLEDIYKPRIRRGVPIASREPRSQRAAALVSGSDQLDFLDPLESPEQAYLRINRLLNLKPMQQSVQHAIEVSLELDTLLTTSRNDNRKRFGDQRKSQSKSEEELFYKGMAQKLQQLRGMLEARKALDAALLSLLNQGCGM